MNKLYCAFTGRGFYISIPIIEVDKPYFEYICHIQQPQIILFTNPATVKGTMERLRQYADMHQKLLDIEVMVINDVFELLMRNQKKLIIK
ncbi:hypothetical protein IPU53_06360 [Bacillus sp. SD088]|nr:hypothetical protein [Bacillus sp. SD088]